MKKKDEADLLRSIFGDLPREEMPGRLNETILRDIRKRETARASKRSDIRWIALGSALSSALVAGAIWLLHRFDYSLGIGIVGYLRDLKTPGMEAANQGLLPFWIMIAACALLLLFIDMGLSVRRKKHHRSE